MLVVQTTRPVGQTHGVGVIMEDVEPVTIVLVLKSSYRVTLKNSGRRDVYPRELLVVEDNCSDIGTSRVSLVRSSVVSEEDTTDEDLTADTLTVVSASRDLNKGVDGTESRGGSEGLRKGKVVDFAS